VLFPFETKIPTNTNTITNPPTGASDGFCLNLTAVLLRMARPFVQGGLEGSPKFAGTGWLNGSGFIPSCRMPAHCKNRLASSLNEGLYL